MEVNECRTFLRSVLRVHLISVPMDHTCVACGYSIHSPVLKRFPDSTMDTLVKFDDLSVITCKECGFSFPDGSISRENLNEYYSKHYSGFSRKIGNLTDISMTMFDKNNWHDPRSLSQVIFN